MIKSQYKNTIQNHADDNFLIIRYSNKNVIIKKKNLYCYNIYIYRGFSKDERVGKGR